MRNAGRQEKKQEFGRELELQFFLGGATITETYAKRNDFERFGDRVFIRQWPNLSGTFRHHDGSLFHVGVHDGFQ